MALSLVNRKLVQHFTLEILVKYATRIVALSMLVMAVAVKMQWGGSLAIVVLVFIFFSMNGIVAATSTAAALDAMPTMTGSASALIGALQYGSGIISSLLLAWLNDGTPWTMAWIMALFTAASAAMVAGVGAKPVSEE